MNRMKLASLACSLLVLFLGRVGTAQDGNVSETKSAGAPTVSVTRADESKFPDVSVEFLITNPDGSPLLDAKEADVKVYESEKEMKILEFSSPLAITSRPTTIVLVVDRSGSMRQEGRIVGLKQAVARFLEGLPKGSKIAVIAFGDRVELICPFTLELDRAQAAVDELIPMGSTRYYDAVLSALEMLQGEQGRRAILALTDGLDTSSRNDIEDVVTQAKSLRLSVNTLGLGSDDEIAGQALEVLAKGTGGRYYPARDVEQLKAIYEEIARSIKNSYSLTYRTDNRLPDGTLRPISIAYRLAKEAGKTAVFIRGMVVPAGGWPRLFVFLLALLACLGLLPAILKTRKKVAARGLRMMGS